MASDPDINATLCPWEEKAFRARTDGFRYFNLSYAVLEYIVLASFSIAWFFNRKSPYLHRRSGTLVFFSVIGLVMQTLTGPLSRFNPEYLTCELDIFLYMTVLPTIVWPLNVRLILWANRVRFNFAIARIVAKNGLDEVNTRSEELWFYRFTASRTFGLIMVFVVLIPLWAISYVYVEFELCRCNEYLTKMFLFFVVVGLGLVVSALAIVYKLQDVPDVIELRKETIQAYTSGAVISFTGLVLQFADVGGFAERIPQSFDWAVMIDVGLACGFFFTMPLQVIRSYYHKEVGSRKKESLEEFLSSERGTHIFQLYLATELSMENLLFYNSVLLWKSKFNKEAEEAYETAKKVYYMYLKPGADLEVNVGQDPRLQVEKTLSNGPTALSDTIFDEVAEDVFKLMANDSYENFLKSDFFKLYTGEISPEEIAYIQSTGVTSYAQFEVVSSPEGLRSLDL